MKRSTLAAALITLAMTGTSHANTLDLMELCDSIMSMKSAVAVLLATVAVAACSNTKEADEPLDPLTPHRRQGQPSVHLATARGRQ